MSHLTLCSLEISLVKRRNQGCTTNICCSHFLTLTYTRLDITTSTKYCSSQIASQTPFKQIASINMTVSTAELCPFIFCQEQNNPLFQEATTTVMNPLHEGDD